MNVYRETGSRSIESALAGGHKIINVRAPIKITRPWNFGTAVLKFESHGQLDFSEIEPNPSTNTKERPFRVVNCDIPPIHAFVDSRNERGQLSPGIVGIENKVDCVWFGAKNHTDSTVAVKAALTSTHHEIKHNGERYIIHETLDMRNKQFIGNSTAGQMFSFVDVDDPKANYTYLPTPHNGLQPHAIRSAGLENDPSWAKSYHSKIYNCKILCGKGLSGIHCAGALGELTSFDRLLISNFYGAAITNMGWAQWPELTNIWMLGEKDGLGTDIAVQRGIDSWANMWTSHFRASGITCNVRNEAVYAGGRVVHISDAHFECNNNFHCMILGPDSKAGNYNYHLQDIDIGSGKGILRKKWVNANAGYRNGYASSVVLNNIQSRPNTGPSPIYTDELLNINIGRGGVSHFSHNLPSEYHARRREPDAPLPTDYKPLMINQTRGH